MFPNYIKINLHDPETEIAIFKCTHSLKKTKIKTKQQQKNPAVGHFDLH